MFSGLSLFGERSMEARRERYDREGEATEFGPLEVAAYSLFGGQLIPHTW